MTKEDNAASRRHDELARTEYGKSIADQSDRKVQQYVRALCAIEEASVALQPSFYEEDLGKVVDLCGHGTWANADLCEIIQELVDPLSPLQTMSKGHEERFVALEAVQKTAQEQASGETQRTTEQTREFTVSLFGKCIARIWTSGAWQCRTSAAGSTLLFWATTNLNGLRLCLGGHDTELKPTAQFVVRAS